MKHNITTIEQHPQQEAAASRIADVTETENGEARTVLAGREELPVIAHADGVPALNVGDRVIYLATDEGAIVTHRLRAPGERPSQGFTVRPDGSLSIETHAGITLATDHATIELHADGRILVDGREITSHASALQAIYGHPVKLN